MCGHPVLPAVNLPYKHLRLLEGTQINAHDTFYLKTRSIIGSPSGFVKAPPKNHSGAPVEGRRDRDGAV
jgi:hypothetical protein